jgi:hypothetical protein
MVSLFSVFQRDPDTVALGMWSRAAMLNVEGEEPAISRFAEATEL